MIVRPSVWSSIHCLVSHTKNCERISNALDLFNTMSIWIGGSLFFGFHPLQCSHPLSESVFGHTQFILSIFIVKRIEREKKKTPRHRNEKPIKNVCILIVCTCLRCVSLVFSICIRLAMLHIELIAFYRYIALDGNAHMS